MNHNNHAASVFGTGAIARVVRAGIAVLIVAATVQAYGPNLFAFFTILSNSMAALLLFGQAVNPRWMSTNGSVRGAVTLYMVITGVVYALLLAPLNVDVGNYAPWANFVHHSLAPAALLIDWLLFPPSRRLPSSAVWWWLAFPAAYLGFSLIRGANTGWYPYPFLNVDELGVVGVALYSVVILGAFLGIGTFLRWWADRRGVLPEPTP